MRQTWRWFGPNDTVSVNDMMQAGVKGVVTALHHIPAGQEWTDTEIQARQKQIATAEGGIGSELAWEVVESLPVSEEIKLQTGNWRDHVSAYQKSMRAIASAGIEVICYNFMPVLDWTRTQLRARRKNGATCMRFDLIDFATFDIHILSRPGAESDFPPEVVSAAFERFAGMDEAAKVKLVDNIICGLPGTYHGYSLQDLRDHLTLYTGVSAEAFRQHQIDFLSEVIPVAEDLGLRLCCHPDDPPFSLLGLPRIMSTEDDYRQLVEAVPSPANGITLCSGSLGVRADNDIAGMVDRLGEHIHFVHLRNVTREGAGAKLSFFEDEHLEGATDMVAVIAALLREEARRSEIGRSDTSIPFRPDHGPEILSDLKENGQPGYPAIGRLKGLAELRGIIAALEHPEVGSPKG